MWLLNARTRRLKLFMSDTQVPRYAILSHTWGDDEVSFNDWRTLGPEAVAEKDGFTKIDYCCKQAVDDGLSWAWIDTCCIDKTSSAELSEAINSMFRWYKNASACYAYLSDVGTIASTDRARIERQLAQSRWFTRGWTLQELLAPQNLVLLSKDWIPIGTKAGLRDVLSSITGIEDEFLCGGSLDEASVAKRMSWAATRQTSRVEDMAYCLMGIFDINMPLLYGEGMKAFRRLQEEIMRSNPRDHTLFAWGKLVARAKRQVDDYDQIRGLRPIPWDAGEAAASLRGLLADSPRDFEFSRDIVPWKATHDNYYYFNSKAPETPSFVGPGVRLPVPVFWSEKPAAYCWARPRLAQARLMAFAALLCGHRDAHTPTIMLPLYEWSYSIWGRSEEIMVDDDVFNKINFGQFMSSIQRTMYVEAERRHDARPGDFIVSYLGQTQQYYLDQTTDYRVHAFPGCVLKLGRNVTGRVFVIRFGVTKSKSLRAFSLAFARKAPRLSHADGNGSEFGPVAVSLITSMLRDVNSTGDSLSGGGLNDSFMDEMLWHHAHKPILNLPSQYERTLALPQDTWTLDRHPFPRITVRVTRVPMDENAGPSNDSSIIDHVEIMIYDRRPPAGASRRPWVAQPQLQPQPQPLPPTPYYNRDSNSYGREESGYAGDDERRLVPRLRSPPEHTSPPPPPSQTYLPVPPPRRDPSQPASVDLMGARRLVLPGNVVVWDSDSEMD